MPVETMTRRGEVLERYLRGTCVFITGLYNQICSKLKYKVRSCSTHLVTANQQAVVFLNQNSNVDQIRTLNQSHGVVRLLAARD